MKQLLTISIAIFLSTNLFSQELPKQKVEKITKEVNTVFAEMLKYAETFKYDKLSTGVDDSYEAGFIANKKYYSHYSKLIDELKSNTPGITQQNISINKKKTTVLSVNIALMTVSGISKATLPDGRSISVTFYWSFVYKLFDNEWKVIHSHQSTGI